MWPISKRVNSPINDDERLLDQITMPRLSPSGFAFSPVGRYLNGMLWRYPAPVHPPLKGFSKVIAIFCIVTVLIALMAFVLNVPMNFATSAYVGTASDDKLGLGTGLAAARRHGEFAREHQ